MKRTCIGIYGGECDYVRRLAGYIRKRVEDSLEVKTFTKREALEACLAQGGVDCVLTEPDGEPLCAEYEVWTALLSEGKTGMTEREIPCIEKYQSAEQIWKLLLKFGGERLTGAGIPLVKTDKETTFIGIASPLHGCGKTSLGLCISRVLGQRERTMFLTLDEFSCLPEILGEGGETAELSELYYYYSQGKLSGARLQSALCRWGEAEYLAPAGELGDLYKEGKPYEASFFRALAWAGTYRYVVIDFGNSLFQKEELLAMSERLYIPEQGSQGSLVRTDCFWGWLERKGFSERAVRCRIPWGTGSGRPDNLRLEFLSEAGEEIRQLLKKDGFLPKGDDER